MVHGSSIINERKSYYEIKLILLASTLKDSEVQKFPSKSFKLMWKEIGKIR